MNKLRGITMVELLVCISVLVIMMGLLFPALQMARESSRRSICSNNLRQIGIAVSAYCSATRAVPADHLVFYNLRSLLEIESSYNRISDSMVEMSPSVVLCPSDPLARPLCHARSYQLNHGSSIKPRNGFVASTDTNEGSIRLESVTDGLSNTAYMSELRCEPMLSDPASVTWIVATETFGKGEETQLRQYLEGIADNPNLRRERRYGWSTAFHSGIHYDHFQTPNLAKVNRVLRDTHYDVAVSASGYHANGVQILLADGAVRFLNDDIEFSAWSTIGSRNAGD